LNALLSIGFLIPVVQSQTQSALESDPKGWQNLFADKTMKDWIRGPLGAAGQLRAVGRQITLWVNGAVTSEFKECEVPRGYIGLEAEGYRAEYRNVQMKPIIEKR
jgi:hypothetical protein